MKIVCDSCGTKYSISDEKVRGKVFKIRCKKCSHIIVVRGTSDAAAAPAAAADGGWHLVVDGEQVGPVPEADIRARYERGEINADTYVWKEGFADWLKLTAVPELADLAGGAVETTGSEEVFAGGGAPVATNGDGSGRQQASRNSGLFGGVAAAASPTDSDVFAAPAPVAARGGGGDLFASPAAASRGVEETRWPAQAAGGAAASHDGGRVESLTGQRHENSVLFSLSNLQSLAMPTAARPISTTAPTSEGSGLIDIRAMAATTLGSPVESRSGGGGGFSDDLPAFGAFSPAAPVLLNLPSSSGPPKWIYPVIGAMLLLVGGIVVLAVKVFSTKPMSTVSEVAPAPTAPAAAAPEAPKPGTVVAAAAPAKTIPEAELPPREGAKGEGKSEGKSESKSEKVEKTEHHRTKGGGKEKKGSSDEKKGAVVAAAPAAPAETPEKKPKAGSLDDLLEGALSGGSKSRAQKPRDDDAPRRAEPAAAAGPLSKSAVVSGMNAIKPKIADCYNQFKVPGMAMVMVVIGKNGKVSTASVSGKFAGTPTGSCVERAVKSASFPPSDGLSTPYPFQLK